MKRYPIWSYSNIFAIDAPMISIAWYLYIQQRFPENHLNIKYCFILGFSVWLGYMADRLLDVKFRKSGRFKTLRHQFCEENNTSLWVLWSAIFVFTLILSAYTINSDKFVVGLAIVLSILVYNALNQYFYNKRFPKEIFIAVIFTLGTFFLIEGPVKFNDFFQFGLICFLNCLILNNKDKEADNKMGINSWTQIFSHRTTTAIALTICFYCLASSSNTLNPFFITSLLCTLLHIRSYQINDEVFRSIIENLYTLIPILAILFNRLAH